VGIVGCQTVGNGVAYWAFGDGVAFLVSPGGVGGS